MIYPEFHSPDTMLMKPGLYNAGIVLLLVMALYGCREGIQHPCSLSPEALADARYQDSMARMPEIRYKDSLVRRKLFQEPPIMQSPWEVYTLLVSGNRGAFDVVRVEDRWMGYRVTRKIRHDAPDTVLHIREFEITGRQWKKLVGGLDSLQFWTYPGHDNRRGLDGEEISIAGFRPRQHPCTRSHFHLVARWSPEDTVFMAMCALFLELEPDAVR